MAHFDKSWTGSQCKGRCFEEGLGRASELICAETSGLVPGAGVLREGPVDDTSVLEDITHEVKIQLDCPNA